MPPFGTQLTTQMLSSKAMSGGRGPDRPGTLPSAPGTVPIQRGVVVIVDAQGNG